MGKLWKNGGGRSGKLGVGGECIAVAFVKCWKSSRVVSEATAVTNRKVLGCDGCGWHVRGVVICSIEQGVCDFIGIQWQGVR